MSFIEIQIIDVIVRNDIYVSRVKKDLIFFDGTAGRYFATNCVGASIWDILENPCSIHDICAQLSEIYAIDDVTCMSETLEFIQELLSAGLVKKSDRV